MNQLIKQSLVDFGLTEKEIDVYIACLEQEENTPTLISKKTKIPRSSVYDIALGLSLKKLLVLKQSTGFDKHQTLISAVNPEKLRDIVREKRVALIDLESNLMDSIPFLKHEYFANRDNASTSAIEIITGYDELKKIYYDVNREVLSQDVYVWDSFLPVDTHGNSVMDKDVSRAVEHAKKNPHQQFEIIPNNLRVRQAVGYHYTREPEYFAYIQHRYVENSLFEFFNRIEIRGDRVYIFSNQRDELYCITIKSKNFATTLKSIFLLQWTTATPLTKDVLATWSENYLREFEA